MSRLILLLAAVVLVGWWLSQRRSPPRSDEASKKQPPVDRSGAQQMVSCAHCGVHLPQSDALPVEQGAFYCTEEHRHLGPRPVEKP